MTGIPSKFDAQFDFCWSVCSFEHLGTLQKGLQFVQDAMRTLKPGGVAVHTTEYNVSDGETIDNWATVLYQRRHFATLQAMIEDVGCKLVDIDFDVGHEFFDCYVDIPPYSRDSFGLLSVAQPPHVKVSVDGFPTTSIAIIVEKPLRPLTRCILPSTTSATGRPAGDHAQEENRWLDEIGAHAASLGRGRRIPSSNDLRLQAFWLSRIADAPAGKSGQSTDFCRRHDRALGRASDVKFERTVGAPIGTVGNRLARQSLPSSPALWLTRFLFSWPSWARTFEPFILIIRAEALYQFVASRNWDRVNGTRTEALGRAGIDAGGAVSSLSRNASGRGTAPPLPEAGRPAQQGATVARRRGRACGAAAGISGMAGGLAGEPAGARRPTLCAPSRKLICPNWKAWSRRTGTDAIDWREAEGVA